MKQKSLKIEKFCAFGPGSFCNTTKIFFQMKTPFSVYYKEFIILPGWTSQILSHFASRNREKTIGLRQNCIIMTHNAWQLRRTALFDAKNPKTTCTFQVKFHPSPLKMRTTKNIFQIVSSHVVDDCHRKVMFSSIFQKKYLKTFEVSQNKHLWNPTFMIWNFFSGYYKEFMNLLGWASRTLSHFASRNCKKPSDYVKNAL